MKTEKRTQKTMVCTRNAHYADSGMHDEEGRPLKVFVPALYVEQSNDYYVYIIENDGEHHEFMSEADASAFQKTLKG